MLWWFIYNVSYFGEFKSLRKISITKKLKLKLNTIFDNDIKKIS